MPRIRNWKHLVLYRPYRETRYEHIDRLFTGTIDWDLIGTHLPDMLRVGISIAAGTITPSTILRKLSTYSRKNRLYLAFRELGVAVRTGFLLQYIGDAELRSIIQAATNKSESFNDFVKWLAFGGGGVIAENDRAEQRKLIKYNHLLANCLIFHNVCMMTRALHTLRAERVPIEPEAVAALSPLHPVTHQQVRTVHARSQPSTSAHRLRAADLHRWHLGNARQHDLIDS